MPLSNPVEWLVRGESRSEHPVARSQVNVLMWAVQPALAGALNREFRQQSQEEEDEDRLYPVVLVRAKTLTLSLTLIFAT